MGRIINKDYIGVVKEENGLLKYYEVDIPQEDALIKELDEMINNDDLSVLDVQEKFISVYPPKLDIYKTDSCPKVYYDYLYPNLYSEAYVDVARYPQIWTKEKYYQDLEEEENMYREAYYKKVKENADASNMVDIDAQIESKVAASMKEYIRRVRKKFDYKQFVYARNYAKTAGCILQDDNCRMISTDQLGWKYYRFNLNKYVSIFVSTNFGYGSSSYFFCNLSYKGVDILPYSAIVKYRYAGWLNLTRYTRQYEVCRTSWKYVFEFVVQAANIAKTDPDLFVETYITKEIQVMMEGLRAILYNPKKCYERLLIAKWDNPIGYYNLVFNISNSEKKEYMVAQNEKIIAFKMEKVTGSLLFLANLRQLGDILPMVEEYVNEIIQMNIPLLSEIEMHKIKVTKDIEKTEINLKKLENEIDKIDASLKKLNPDDYHKWHKLSDDLKADKISSSVFVSKLTESVSSVFINMLLKMQGPLNTQKNEMQNLIELRKKFLEHLDTFDSIIRKYACAA